MFIKVTFQSNLKLLKQMLIILKKHKTKSRKIVAEPSLRKELQIECTAKKKAPLSACWSSFTDLSFAKASC